MDAKRSVEHYRDHELVYEIELQAGGGWHYTIHILGHEGDTDVVRQEEGSVEHYPTDVSALRAAEVRARAFVDALLDKTRA